MRYNPNERHDLHDDFKAETFPIESIGPRCNRLVSFFIYIGDDCTGGETNFPYLKAAPADSDARKFRRDEGDQGLIVRPVSGNGIMWVNLHKNGTGDERSRHAALQVLEGTKVGMNILGDQCY